MGRTLELQHLSEEECTRILQVIQKDFELRQKEKERLSKVEEVLEVETEKTWVLAKQKTFNEHCCIRCCHAFGFIFNRRQTCLVCRLNVCKNCSQYSDAEKSYTCHICAQSVDLKRQSCEWFYSNVRQRFKRFGSAKVVRSLYKRKSARIKPRSARSDGDLSDSFIDPALCSSLQSSSTKPRPPLQGVFPELSIKHSTQGGELDLSSISEKSPPTKPARSALFTEKPPPIKPAVTKDVYKEKIENLQKREDEETEKFRKKFENALSELYRSLDNQTPSGIPSDGKYNDFVSNYRNQFKDLLANFSDILHTIHKNANGRKGPSRISPSQIRQTLSKVVEDAVGDAIDWGSDEAVSDLSTSTEEGNDLNTSYEEQLAQTLLTKVVDKHRKDAEEKETIRKREKELEEKQKREELERENEKDVVESVTNGFNYDEEFDKLIRFSQGTSSRPKPKPKETEEEKLPVINESPILKVTRTKDESELGLADRVHSLDKVHDTHLKLPDFNIGSLGFNEVDPDLVSLSHSELEDNGCDDLDYGSESSTRRMLNRSWQDNWILGDSDSQTPTFGSAGKSPVKRIKRTDLSNSMFVHVPEMDDGVSPRVGNREADELSDMSENEDRDSEFVHSDNSDVENSYYAQTSNEIERVSKRVQRTHSITDSSMQTDDSDMEASRSRVSSAQRLRTGRKLTNGNGEIDSHLKLRLSESLDTSVQSDDSSLPSVVQDQLKDNENIKSSQNYQEMLIPAENNDPKFEFPPDSVTSPEGEPIKLTCRVTGTEPINVFWYRADGDDLEEIEDTEKYDPSHDGNRHTLVVFNTTMSDAGQYTCVALNELGRCCQYFIVKIKENEQELKSPEFMRVIQDVEVTEGRSVKFRCKVKGYPQPRITWLKDGQRISKMDQDYKIEKFGNRDYILAIEYATLDHDAEYTVRAVNIAGDVKRSAQLIVTEEKIESQVDDDNKSSLITAVTVPTSTTIKDKPPSGLKNRCKENQEIANLSQKLTMTRNGVSDVAEDMLSTAGELSMIHAELDAMNRALADMEDELSTNTDTDVQNNNQNNLLSPGSKLGDTFSHQVIDDYVTMKTAAENVRAVTTSAFNILQSAEDVIQMERANQNFIERKSLRESYVRPDVTDNLTVDVRQVRGVEREESKTSVDSGIFSMIGDERNSLQRTSSGRFENKRLSDSGHFDMESELSADEPPRKQTTTIDSRKRSQLQVNLIADEILSSQIIPDDETLDMSEFSIRPARDITPEVDGEKIIFGLKPVDAKFNRDYVIHEKNNSPLSHKKWEVNLNSYSPRAEVVNRRVEEAANTEDKIYMSAGKVFSLEEKVGDLQGRVSKVVPQRTPFQHLSDLEDEVARTCAQVEQSERQVHHVEKVVAQLHHRVENPPPKHEEFNPRGTHSHSISTPRHPSNNDVKAKQSVRGPSPVRLVGETRESDLPSSQTEYSSDQQQIELPSVRRLKNLFSQGVQGDNNSDDPSYFRREASVKSVHSITARSFPKGKLEEFRERVLSSESISPDHSRHRSESFEPDVFSPVNQSMNPGVSVVISTASPQGPSGSAFKKYQAPQPPGVKVTSNCDQQTTEAQVHPVAPPRRKKDSSSDGGAKPKISAPKIKSGCILARAAFWDKRIQDEQSSDDQIIECYPQILTDDNQTHF